LASVQNRANPLGEYGEIRTNVLRSASGSYTYINLSDRLYSLSGSFTNAVATTLTGVSGAFTSVLGAPALRLSTTNTAVASGSLGVGDIVVATGAGGGTATLYIKLASGSVNAIWTVAGVYSTAST
jgi:hypothetical protein